ncbi:hypothetical protein IHE45_05G207600 [Dioscorea alata]|uniref:Uncharacterized protein n=2 Tax=Dioscorea alata TaxID=55571 RepID=A0ACB7W8Q1_DIOAL|nr:hypothetical protein IHE45_05G207600 [Dioscorea alata]KAH7683814.1 hypothetical protein IHE45_05G207600 [Dioscorea alata]
MSVMHFQELMIWCILQMLYVLHVLGDQTHVRTQGYVMASEVAPHIKEAITVTKKLK